MAFDPTLPVLGAPLDPAVLRAQLSALHDEIAAVPAGPPGAAGADGAPGEVAAADLAAAVLGTPHNPSAVFPLGMVVSDPPTQAEMQQLVGKVDELIAALRREP